MLDSDTYAVEARALDGKSWRALMWKVRASTALREYEARVKEFGEERVRIKDGDGRIVPADQLRP
jgi:hypothetical protein